MGSGRPANDLQSPVWVAGRSPWCGCPIFTSQKKRPSCHHRFGPPLRPAGRRHIEPSWGRRARKRNLLHLYLWISVSMLLRSSLVSLRTSPSLLPSVCLRLCVFSGMICDTRRWQSDSLYRPAEPTKETKPTTAPVQRNSSRRGKH